MDPKLEGSVITEQPSFVEMSDEALEQALEEPVKMDAPPEQDKDEASTPESAPAKDAAPTPEQDKVDALKDEAVKEPEQETDLKQALESLKKQHEHLQSLYGRQSNELGKLRAELKPKPTQEDYEADPMKATEQMQEHKEQADQIKRLEQERNLTEVVTKNIRFAQQFSPDLEANAEAIRNLLVEQDKVAPTEANRLLGEIFLQNPWGVFQLNQRARMYKEMQSLKKQIADLKQAPEKVVKQIKNVSQAVPGVNASMGNSSIPDSESGLADPSQLAGATEEQLEAMIKNSLKKGK